MGPLIATNWIVIVLAVLIGLVTARSIWGRQDADRDDATNEVDYDDLDQGPSFAPPADEHVSPPQAALAGAVQSTPDNLQLIKGIGPKLSEQLNALGVTRFDQITAWTEEDIAALDPQLEGFSGRIERDDWVGQARLLTSGFTHEDGGHYAPH